MIYIVGLGPGAEEYILPKAMKTLTNSNRIIGFSRAIKTLKSIEKLKDKNFIEVDGLVSLLEYLKSINSENISIIASGDPTFYSITAYIKKNCRESIEVIPGISSFQYLSAKLGLCWNEAFVGSLHGRDNDFIEIVKNNNISFWLIDKKNSPSFLAEKLIENKIDCKLTIGENLSYENELIFTAKAEEFLNKNFSDLAVLVVEKN